MKYIMGLLLAFSFHVSALGTERTTDVVVNKLRTYCKACHAIGKLKFITSNDNNVVWTYIKSQKSPRSNRVWSELIRETLDWPNGVPPSPDKPMRPGFDWMPKGSKRLDIANDHVQGVPTRIFIINAL